MFVTYNLLTIASFRIRVPLILFIYKVVVNTIEFLMNFQFKMIHLLEYSWENGLQKSLNQIQLRNKPCQKQGEYFLIL